MNIFINPADHRLRAGWRLLLQFILMFILIILGQLMVHLADLMMKRLFESGLQNRLWGVLSQGVMVTLSIWIAARAFDRRRISEYGLQTDRRWWQDLAFGTGAGILAIAAIFTVFFSFGWIEVTGWGWNRASAAGFILPFLMYFLLMAAVGFYEELLTRGYQIRNLAEGLNYRKTGPVWALILASAGTSLIFSVLHAGNPNVAAMALVNISIVGFVFALSYLWTNRLGIAIGIHFSWNFAMGAIFGMPVSGIRFRESVLQTRGHGPELWTGGKFGPEGGIIGFLAIILLLLLIVAYLKIRDGGLRIRTEIADPPAGG
jgi:uncharacterized protein